MAVMETRSEQFGALNGRLSPDEWHDRFLKEHEARMRRVDESLATLEALAGRNGDAERGAAAPSADPRS